MTDSIDLYGSDWAFTGDLGRYGGKSVEAFTFTTNVGMESDAPAFKRFKVGFTQRFDNEPKFLAVLAYEATQVLFSTLRQTPAPGSLPQTLQKPGLMKWPAGPLPIGRTWRY